MSSSILTASIASLRAEFDGWVITRTTAGRSRRGRSPLLDDIEATRLRLAEANVKGWIGETAALEETLHHIGRRRTQLPTQQTTAAPCRPTS